MGPVASRWPSVSMRGRPAARAPQSVRFGVGQLRGPVVHSARCHRMLGFSECVVQQFGLGFYVSARR
eukprot:11171843-Lingulodinium_polyedra.AAC.1